MPIEEQNTLDEFTQELAELRELQRADLRQVIREELPSIMKEVLRDFFKPFVDIVKYAGSLFPKDKK